MDLRQVQPAVALHLFVPGASRLPVGSDGERGRHGRAHDQGQRDAADQAGHDRVAAAPPPGPLRPADPPRADRLAGLEPAQVFRQLRGGLVSLARLLGEALQADGLEVARQAGHQPRGRHRLGRLDLLQGLQRRRAPEWRPAGQAARRGWPRARRCRPRGRPAWLGPRPARAPCSWASPGWTRSGSAPTRSPAPWPGRSR